MQLKARLLLAAAAVTASAGLALGAAAPLATASGPHVVDGSGAAYNDWGDEGTLSVNSPLQEQRDPAAAERAPARARGATAGRVGARRARGGVPGQARTRR
ncbi:hypothetical protein P9869_11230 [Streptomyces ossamyceticus]|nr:hypothetical protein [Streptomyces ossamyceticus]